VSVHELSPSRITRWRGELLCLLARSSPIAPLVQGWLTAARRLV